MARGESQQFGFGRICGLKMRKTALVTGMTWSQWDRPADYQAVLAMSGAPLAVRSGAFGFLGQDNGGANAWGRQLAGPFCV
jgi:hypothetical protein